MGALRKWGPWAALVVIAVVVLSVGLHRTSHPSLDARVQSIASQVRCPVCNGETVAQSQAAPSVEIRNQIRQDLQAGQSQGQILSSLVQSYGAGILEKPQPSGIGVLVWVIPVIGVILGAAGVVLIIRRWRAAPAEPGPVAETGPFPAPAERVAAGAPTAVAASGPARAPVLVAEEAVGALSEPAPAGPASTGGRGPARRRVRWAVAGAGTALVIAGASWAVVASSGTRLPGQSVSGQALPAEEVAQDLQAASADAQKNDAVNALKEYEKVLKADPNQVEALTGMGWLLAETGQPDLVQQGVAQLTSAEKADPTYAPAHLYRGITLLGEGDYSSSIPELQWYLAHNPDPQLTAQVQKALAQAQAGARATSATTVAGG